MRLDVPLKKQKKGSYHCGLACLMMLMEYYRQKCDYDQLLKEAKVYKKLPGKKSGGIYTADLGCLALKRGFKVFLNYHHPGILDKTIEDISEKNVGKLKNYLKKIGEEKMPLKIKRQIEKDIKYIEAGGKYSTKLPTLKSLDKYLNKKIPVMVCLAMNSLRSNPLKESAHFVVIAGKEKNDYWINDPSTRFTKPYKLPSDKLLHSWYNAGSFLMVIDK